MLSLLFSFAVGRNIALQKHAFIPVLQSMQMAQWEKLVDGDRDTNVFMASDGFWLACDLGQTEYVASVHIYASTRRLHTSLTDNLVRLHKPQFLSRTKIIFIYEGTFK